MLDVWRQKEQADGLMRPSRDDCVRTSQPPRHPHAGAPFGPFHTEFDCNLTAIAPVKFISEMVPSHPHAGGELLL